MEFPELGDQCKLPGCHQLDFLPVTCPFCSQTFCKAHFLPFEHACPSRPEVEGNPDARPDHPMPSCMFPTCSKKELVEMLCSHCQLHFCLQHRHQVGHQCVKLEKPHEKMAQTAALVQQIQERNAEKKPVRQGVKSDRLAAKVQLMKLKQHAKGSTELPSQERIYFLVRLPLDKKDEAVFLSHLWSIGKSIDYIASLCQVPNHNNTATKPQLNLFSTSGECLSERKDVLLKELVDSETIFNGQSLTLRYV